MRGDRGSATVLVVAVMTVLLAVGVVLLAIADIAVASVRSRGAADLAAIAGAQAIVDPCSRAATVASANGAALVGCVLDGGDVVTTVEAPLPRLAARVAGLLGGSVSAVRASARAGQELVEQPNGP